MSETERVIWRRPLALTADPQVTHLPLGARVVHVGLREETPNIWFECDPKASFEARVFHVLATGFSAIPPNSEYRGTIHVGWTVWHVYEEVPA